MLHSFAGHVSATIAVIVLPMPWLLIPPPTFLMVTILPQCALWPRSGDMAMRNSASCGETVSKEGREDGEIWTYTAPLAARSSIAILVEIGCDAVADLGVSTGSSYGCESDSDELHFCCSVVLCFAMCLFFLLVFGAREEERKKCR
jgi:hypothetical protein